MWSTGRSGTKHISRALVSGAPPLPPALLAHQDEDLGAPTRAVGNAHYGPLEEAPSEEAFNASAAAVVAACTLPQWRIRLAADHAHRLMYTGQLPAGFGLAPPLLDALPRGTLRVLRLLRARIPAAASLVALGRPEGDPWGSSARATAAGSCAAPPPP